MVSWVEAILLCIVGQDTRAVQVYCWPCEGVQSDYSPTGAVQLYCRPCEAVQLDCRLSRAVQTSYRPYKVVQDD